jgi:hypothetical protein
VRRIVPALGSVRCVSQWLTGGGYSTSQAIADAVSVMSFGDVLLLEAQTTLWGYSLVPVEIEPAVFDVIRLATALGIVVVEAAGNGGVDSPLRSSRARHWHCRGWLKQIWGIASAPGRAAQS